MTISQLCNSVEVFKRERVLEDDIASAKEALQKAGEFEGFDREKMRLFVQVHQKALPGLRGEQGSLETAMFEIGLFGGAANYRQIPAILTSALEECVVAPFSITRLICENRKNEQVLIQLEGEKTLLHFFQEGMVGCWIEKPCLIKIGRNTEALDYQWISKTPERFLRYSHMIEEHFEIELVARKTLSGVLPTNLVNLALQYAGYPTQSQKENAEANKEKLKKELGSKELVPYELPK